MPDATPPTPAVCPSDDEVIVVRDVCKACMDDRMPLHISTSPSGPSCKGCPENHDTAADPTPKEASCPELSTANQPLDCGAEVADPTPAEGDEALPLTLDDALHHLNSMAALVNDQPHHYSAEFLDQVRVEHFIPVRDFMVHMGSVDCHGCAGSYADAATELRIQRDTARAALSDSRAEIERLRAALNWLANQAAMGAWDELACRPYQRRPPNYRPAILPDSDGLTMAERWIAAALTTDTPEEGDAP